jgi:hypothetical protein
MAEVQQDQEHQMGTSGVEAGVLAELAHKQSMQVLNTQLAPPSGELQEHEARQRLEAVKQASYDKVTSGQVDFGPDDPQHERLVNESDNLPYTAQHAGGRKGFGSRIASGVRRLFRSSQPQHKRTPDSKN